MNKDFVPYEQSRKLSELGFNELCIKQYSHDGWLTFTVNDWGQPRPETGHEIRLESAGLQIAAPTFAQAFRWFRETHELYSFVFKFDEGFGYETYREGVTQTNDSFDTYEEAELACLTKLVEIVENEKV